MDKSASTKDAGSPVMISLASRQVWPHILSVVEFRPRSLILLHSIDQEESQEPAARLKTFCEQSNLLAAGQIHLEPIPHNDYRGVQGRLNEIARTHSLSPKECLVNFTGGNKLMATAALDWAERHWIDAFYLERGFELIEFTTQSGGVHTPKPRQLDFTKTNHLDAVKLLACQLGAARVESANEKLVLSERGKKTHLKQLQAEMKQVETLGRSSVDYRLYLQGYDQDAIQKAGFNLEYACAVVLLKLGVPAVYRSVELKSATMQGARLEGELDLVFNWDAKLWIVDCKDKVGAGDKVQAVRVEMIKLGGPDARTERLLSSIEADMREKDLKVLREDLSQVVETGGLLGRALCVRSSPLPPQAVAFAKSRKLPVIYKNEMERQLSALLLRNAQRV